jgi:hypothetical protein
VEFLRRPSQQVRRSGPHPARTRRADPLVATHCSAAHGYRCHAAHTDNVGSPTVCIPVYWHAAHGRRCHAAQRRRFLLWNAGLDHCSSMVRLTLTVSVSSVQQEPTRAPNRSHARPQTPLATCRCRPVLGRARSLHPNAQGSSALTSLLCGKRRSSMDYIWPYCGEGPPDDEYCPCSAGTGYDEDDYGEIRNRHSRSRASGLYPRQAGKNSSTSTTSPASANVLPRAWLTRSTSTSSATAAPSWFGTVTTCPLM